MTAWMNEKHSAHVLLSISVFLLNPSLCSLSLLSTRHCSVFRWSLYFSFMPPLTVYLNLADVCPAHLNNKSRILFFTLFYLCLSCVLWANTGLAPFYLFQVQAYLTTKALKPDQALSLTHCTAVNLLTSQEYLVGKSLINVTIPLSITNYRIELNAD